VSPSSIPIHPSPSRRIRRVPDDSTVWAFSDVHGVLSGLETGLREAGLVDDELHWSAAPGTALIGCGDYVDRGRESRRLVAWLRQLGDEAAAAGGAVELARGNHELQLLQAANGDADVIDIWLRYGGWPTLASWDLAGTADEVPALLRRLDELTPGVLAWFADLAEAVRWRDVLFVHGGLVPEASLSDLGVRTDDHLYVRATFFTTPWSSGEFARYEMEGVRRVVFGHTPQPYGDSLFHGGRSLAIDTNAGRNPNLPEDARSQITLVELRGGVSLADARRVVVPVEGAPDGVAPA
jgi:diadenosine tetraphosphatase ApaH/serine/threonine PP2A family protein phosphatase